MLLDTCERVVVVLPLRALFVGWFIEPPEAYEDGEAENKSNVGVLIHGLIFYCSFEEGEEEWVWVEDGAAVFWVELAADVPFVGGDFHYLDESGVGVGAGGDHSGVFEVFEELGVVFVAVSVSFADVGFAVYFVGFAAGFEGAVVGTETHGAAFVGDVFLVFHDVDDWVGRGVVHFGAVGFIPV